MDPKISSASRRYDAVKGNPESVEKKEIQRNQAIQMHVMEIHHNHASMGQMTDANEEGEIAGESSLFIAHTDPVIRIRSEPDLSLQVSAKAKAVKESVNEIFEKNLHKRDLDACIELIADFPHLLVAGTSKGKKFLTTVAQAGDVDIFSEFHALVPNWDERLNILQRRDGFGYTPLMYAVENGNVDILPEILCVTEPENLIDMRMPDGCTVLMAAARHYDVQIFGTLLNAVQDPYRKQALLLKIATNGGSVLSSAVIYGNVKIVDFIFNAVRNPEHKEKLITRSLNNNVTLLMRAASKGYAKIVARLLEESSDSLAFICRQDDEGRTVLDYAVTSGEINIVTMLLEKLDNPLHKNMLIGMARNNGTTGLMVAVQRGHWHLISILLQAASYTQGRADLIGKARIDGVTVLMMAAKCGQKGLVEMLLGEIEDPQRREAFIQAAAIDGTTVLMLAVQYGSAGLVRALLHAVSNPDALLKMTDLDGHSAMSFARLRNDQEIIRLLQKAKS